MVLQRLTFGQTERKMISELYYHSDAKLQVSEKEMRIPAGTSVRFDTYFNVFLSKNWLRYTTVKKISLHLLVRGAGSVRLWGDKEKPLEELFFRGEQELIFMIHLEESTYIYPELLASADSALLCGSIQTVKEDIEKTEAWEPVRLALVTCTYNRHDDIIRNLSCIKKYNQEANTEDVVLDWVYVVDNARSLKKSEIEGERVSLIPNKNTGGAGGFTRGLEEAMKREDITHIVLMDDDVQIEFEAFRRSKVFLSYCKPKYRENFLGGAMLRTDEPYILHAAGEDWADGFIKNPHKNTDLRGLSQVLRISEPMETKQAYAGWWYCCIPRSHVEQKGYPMPFFLHCDDVEYSLRSGKPPLYLNGIAVWHEEFEDKRASVMEYYDVRNRLITNAIYKECGKWGNELYILCERFYATVFRYRYKDFSLSVRAVEDFLKGPKWLREVDAEALHRELLACGYQWDSVQGTPEHIKRTGKSKVSVILRYFFPASGSDVIRMGAPVSAYAGKKKMLLVEPKQGKGFEVRKSWKETAGCVGRLVSCLCMMVKYKVHGMGRW